MRKGFNCYRSYWEVANELNDKDRLAFYDALLKKQFTGMESELTGMAKFAYLSQKHSIDNQIDGYLSQMAKRYPSEDPWQGGSVAPSVTPTVQEKEKEEEKEEEKEIIVPFQERVNKFLIWFNSEFTKHGKQQAKFRTLSNQTENNLKKLLDKYNPQEWSYAFSNMISSEWVIESKNATPDHFLRPSNFEKYLNQVREEETFKAAWQ